MLFNIIFKQYLNIFIRNFVLCIQIRFVSTEKTTRIASRASCFSYTHSSTLSVLFQSYCMIVYGSQLWSYNDFRAVERFYTAWRKTIRRIWRIDKRTHNLLIHAINNCLPISLLLEKKMH